MLNIGREKQGILDRFQKALKSIGYLDKRILSPYSYADFVGKEYKDREIQMAAFAREPVSYRNVCFGFTFSENEKGAANIEKHKALGAPLIFELTDNEVSLWKIMESELPILYDKFEIDNIESTFRENKDKWNPDTIFRARNIPSVKEAIQLDFVDLGNMSFLEGILHRKLDSYLIDIANRAKEVYRHICKREIDDRSLFRLIFRFISAKILFDRDCPLSANRNDPFGVLQAVENYYRVNDRKQTLLNLPGTVFDEIWDRIENFLHFKNLSVEDLAFIYENTFISDETRKQYGTHSTPYKIAEYMVRNLPFEDVAEENRFVFEPCSGHGVFLVAAMERMRDLLEGERTEEEKHNYFVERLMGMEIDSFAVEASRLSLSLADFPNHNGWDLHNEDIFLSDKFDRYSKRANIVLCNPPFEKFTKEEQQKYQGVQEEAYKPVEVLKRVLNNPPELMGFVLPLTSIHGGGGYKDLRKKIASLYSDIRILNLPDKIFTYSEAETAVILASGRKNDNRAFHLVNDFVSKADRENFLSGGEISGSSEKSVKFSPKSKDVSFRIPRFKEIWDYMRDMGYGKLSDYVDEIHKGICWKSEQKRKEENVEGEVILDSPEGGYLKGYDVVRGMDQLIVYREAIFLSLKPEHQLTNGYRLSWKDNKVVFNAARKSRGPWRLTPYYDDEGIALYKNFFAIWAKNETRLKLIAAILNSPVANAYSYDYDLDRHNHIYTIKNLRIPPERILLENKVDKLFDEYLEVLKLIRNLKKDDTERKELEEKAKKLLLQLDAAVLKSYDLPPRLEKQLLDLFQGEKRPVPFEFNGYYPEGFTAYIPLHMYISDEFQASRGDKLLERLSPINDPIISEMMDWVREVNEVE